MREEKAKKENMKNLIHAFETSYANGDYEKELQTLSQAICFSVLKKLLDKASDTDCKKLTQLRREIIPSISNLENVNRLSSTDGALTYDKNGNMKFKHDAITENAISTLIQSRLGDGLDLVQECNAFILEEKRTGLSLEETYAKTAPKKHIFTENAYYTDADLTDTRQYETTGIQETYRHIRKYIQKNGGVKACISMYTYVDIDGVDDAYIRLGKCADIGGRVCDFNGKETAYTATICDVEKRKEMIQKLNLTPKQAQILKYLEMGMQQKLIAQKLGITQMAVYDMIQRIRKKATDILDISPRTMAKVTQTKRNVSGELCEKILRLSKSGYSKRYIAKECKCGMSTIYKVLNDI